jgi:hypothetical protein
VDVSRAYRAAVASGAPEGERKKIVARRLKGKGTDKLITRTAESLRVLRHEPHLAAGETLVLAAGSRALAVEVARRLGRTAAEWLGRAAEHRLAKYVEAEAEWARRVARARKEHERKRARAGGEEGGQGDGEGGDGSATMIVDVGPGAGAGGAAAAGGFSEASVRGGRRPDRTDPYVLRTLLQEGFALPAASTGVHDMQLLRAFLDSYKDEVPDKGAFDSLIDAEAAARVAKRRRAAAEEEEGGEGGEEGRARGAASSSASAAAGALPWVPSPLSPPRSRWRGYRARHLPASVARGGAGAGVGAGAGATDAFFRAADSDSGEAALGAAATPVKGVRRGGGVEETKGGDEEE